MCTTFPINTLYGIHTYVYNIIILTVKDSKKTKFTRCLILISYELFSIYVKQFKERNNKDTFFHVYCIVLYISTTLLYTSITIAPSNVGIGGIQKPKWNKKI